jgi:dienelactone hydrolase
MEPITGTAAGVPFTALPPAVAGPAPLLVTWHMMDPPRTNAAFAAALPLHDVPAWRVHLGMPLSGERSLPGGDAAFFELARRDTMLAYLDPIVRQAADEFPAALAELRERLPVDDGPIGVVGGSLGGAVALRILARREIPVAAAAVVNAAIRIRSVVGLVEDVTGTPYSWHEESRRVADRLDFVARAGDVAGPPLLVVSGELDHPALRTDAAELADALRERYAEPEHVALVEIPGLAHPLAEHPGLEPAPQLPTAKAVDDAMTEWFLRHLRS